MNYFRWEITDEMMSEDEMKFINDLCNKLQQENWTLLLWKDEENPIVISQFEKGESLIQLRDILVNMAYSMTELIKEQCHIKDKGHYDC